MVFATLNLTAIMYSACYYASHSGKLNKVLLTLPVTQDCVTSARRTAIVVTATMWIAAVVNLSIVVYTHFTIDGGFDFTIAPFVTYFDVPEGRVTVAKICGCLAFIFLFPGMLIAHGMSLLIVFIFWHQFNKLKRHFRRAVGKRGYFNGDLSLFRRRHSKVKT